jgi:hypothetical protein
VVISDCAGSKSWPMCGVLLMTTVKQIPILFNDEMVRAILDGRKTQTRRTLKVQPPTDGHQLLNVMDSTDRRQIGKSHWAVLNAKKTMVIDGHKKFFSCPFGKPGDQLWVRETWQGPLVPYELSHELFKDSEQFESPQYCEYRANGGSTPVFINADDEECQRWRPSIHMPRWASRITLEITSVRVQRLQDISEDDSMAEGIPFEGDQPSPRDNFSALWESIIGAGSWDENPWVWVIEFKRVDSEVMA